MDGQQQLRIQFAKVNPDLLREFEEGPLRQDLAKRIDQALRSAGVGKWSGTRARGQSIEVSCKVTDLSEAQSVVRLILADHPLLPYLVE